METLREKILSIPCHLTNHHHFPNNQKHKKCSHDDLSQEERNKPWLEEGSKEVAKVKMALTGTDNGRLNDLSKMTGNFFRWNIKIKNGNNSGFHHTGPLENLNSLSNKYANKAFVYGYFFFLQYFEYTVYFFLVTRE